MSMSPFGLFGTIFPIMFMLVFALVFGIILVTIFRSVKTWNRNNHSPVLTVDATIVSRRTSVSHHHNHTGNGVGHTHTSTSYYVTFQVESGDRMELQIDYGEYGYLVEGDKGKLSFQGTRYLKFERN